MAKKAKFDKKSWKKQRKIEHLKSIDNKIYIFCEGIRTEPNYFLGFKEAIENNATYKNLILIDIIGVGAETLSILEYAKSYVKTNHISNSDVWIVYDKDDFPAKRFNQVAIDCTSLTNSTSNTYKVAWSNQCIEYWFLLHFCYYNVNNDRSQYISLLKKYLKNYEKNDSEIFARLLQEGNPKDAIKFAEKQLHFFKGMSDSKSAPATKVQNLIKELAEYLPEDLKNSFM